MNRRTLLVAAIVPLAAACGVTRPDPAPAARAAARLEPGSWTGAMTWCCARPASARAEAIQHRLDAVYDVRARGDTLDIIGHFTEPHTAERLSLPFHDVKVFADSLTFRIEAGDRAECTLTRRDDGAFEGPCRAARTEGLRYLMLPPASPAR